MSGPGLQQNSSCRETDTIGCSCKPSHGSANLFAMALVIVKSVCAMMVSFGIFPLAKALCQAAGVRLPKGTSTFIFWRGGGEGEGRRGEVHEE